MTYSLAEAEQLVARVEAAGLVFASRTYTGTPCASAREMFRSGKMDSSASDRRVPQDFLMFPHENTDESRRVAHRSRAAGLANAGDAGCTASIWSST